MTMDGAFDTFRSFLHQRSLRWTDVREAILRAVLEHSGHFRAEDLVETLRRRGVEVSAATVYRALPLLLEARIIELTEVSGDIRFYEAAYGREPHDHLICRRCKKVVEFQFEAFAILEREIAARYDFELVDHFHELIGVCGTCRREIGPIRAH